MNHIGPLEREDAGLIVRRQLVPTDDRDPLSESALRRFQYRPARFRWNVFFCLCFFLMNPIGCRI